MSIPVAAVLNHWTHTFQDFSLSSTEFYNELNYVIAAQKMPNTKTGLVTHKEGGTFSASREYMRIQHRDLVFDICAAPFGTNFFISWWLYETQGVMRSLFGKTSVGNLLQARAAKRTFFQMDLEQMFKDCVHESVLSSVAKVTEGKGVRLMTDTDKAYKAGGL